MNVGKEGESCIKCTVISCANYFYKDLPDSDLRFFPFPADREITKKWKEKCGVAANHTIVDSVVCSEHFKFSDYVDSSLTELKPEAIPKDKLGWMLGMPEVKLGNLLRLDKPSDLLQIKEAVDTNEQLKKRLEELKNSKKILEEKAVLFRKKNDNVDKEITRLMKLIEKYSGRRSLWKSGNSLIFKVFSRAQINLLMGKRKVVWSYDDMAMAFTLRHLGNRECYLYLKDTLNFPLPALSAVQRWAASNKMQT